MPNTIQINLLDNKQTKVSMRGIPLATENSYRIIAGEENATEFAIISKPTQYASARYTVEMVNSRGYGLSESDISDTITISGTTYQSFVLPKGMAVAGYGYISIKAYQDTAETTVDGSISLNASTFDSIFLDYIKYIFTYNGTAWEYDGNVIDIVECGIALTGTPSANDTITVNKEKVVFQPIKVKVWNTIPQTEITISPSVDPDMPIFKSLTITPADWDNTTKLATIACDWAVAGMSATFAPVENSMNVFTDIAVQGVYCTNILNGDLLFKSGSGATVNENITLNVTAYNDGKGIIVNASVIEAMNKGMVAYPEYSIIVSNGNGNINNATVTIKWEIPSYDGNGNPIIQIGSTIDSGSNIDCKNLISELYLKNNIKYVYGNSFAQSQNLKKLFIGKNVTYIGQRDTFRNCPLLSEVVFESGRTEPITIETISNYCTLGHNSSLEELVIPDNSILRGMSFGNCANLKKVRIGAGTSFANVSFPNGVPFNGGNLNECTFLSETPADWNVGAGTFNNWASTAPYTADKYCFVPYDSLTAYTTATNWASYANYMYGIGKFTSGVTLPTETTDGNWGLTWYATKADLKASNNPITVAPSEFDNEYGEIYCAKSQYVVVPFAEASWAEIKEVFRSGNASNYWSVGDTKSITINGNQYTIRIADMQAGRYSLADGSGFSNGVFEFVELIDKRYMKPTKSNTGGWADSYMKNTVMSEIYDLLPNELKDVISEVNVLSGTGEGTTSGTSSSINKLFLLAEMELFSSGNYSIGISECPLGQFDYYRTHDTDTYRIKKYPDNTNGTWWLRSPISASSDRFCDVSTTGTLSWGYGYDNYGVSPCFAI